MSFSLIDDRDPKITYTGTWNLGGTPNEYNGTVSSSIKVGNHFSVPFTGTAIGVYGTFDSSSAGVETSYEIDGGPTTTVTSRSSGKDSFQQLFWQSDPVGTGPHTLVVTMVAVNTNFQAGEGTVWFDYFNSASSHAGLIGGVVAGVVVLILAAGLLFLYLRRRRKRNATSITPLPAPVPAPMAESSPQRAVSSGKRGPPNPHPNPNPGAPATAAYTPTSAPSSSYGPSESGASQSGRGASSTAGDTPTTTTAAHADSVADLKRRQQEVVSSYEAGINGGHAAGAAHTARGQRDARAGCGASACLYGYSTFEALGTGSTTSFL
ncbi:Amidohydro-rel domain-containing protein [Mycena venus]|uniref:Amidohydro-rel domain-containing protein n=1 Tax=Mycena venus TaxID=2733690 RepID=A0A8H6Y243_9AGAR|nr:Amidohydro-rel domain-containing protein [Mycena venus]